MKILIACEESQTVCRAFRAKGHEAYSCDILPCSGGHPEWHIQGDVLKQLNKKWDMIIAHPPCTYMSNAGACRMYPTKGVIDKKRLKLGLEAKDFFMKFINAKCKKIVVENPLPLKVIGLPSPTQIIQPYQFGEPFSKKTLLWIKGLPELKHTKILDKWQPYIESGTSRNKGKNKDKHFAQGSIERSKTFQGIADAMAEQWG